MPMVAGMAFALSEEYAGNTAPVQPLCLWRYSIRPYLRDCGCYRELPLRRDGNLHDSLAAIVVCRLDHDVADRAVRGTRHSKPDAHLDPRRLSSPAYPPSLCTRLPATSDQPSTSTTKISLNGSDTTTGGSIIMPIDIRTEATTRAMIRKGRNSRNPISNARFSSEIMKAGTRMRSDIASGPDGGG